LRQNKFYHFFFLFVKGIAVFLTYTIGISTVDLNQTPALVSHHAGVRVMKIIATISQFTRSSAMVEVLEDIIYVCYSSFVLGEGEE
jgi:hypothetical protein